MFAEFARQHSVLVFAALQARKVLAEEQRQVNKNKNQLLIFALQQL